MYVIVNSIYGLNTHKVVQWNIYACMYSIGQNTLDEIHVIAIFPIPRKVKILETTNIM